MDHLVVVRDLEVKVDERQDAGLGYWDRVNLRRAGLEHWPPLSLKLGST